MLGQGKLDGGVRWGSEREGGTVGAQRAGQFVFCSILAKAEVQLVT